MGAPAIQRWNTRPIGERALPAGLVWEDEPPNPDHRVAIALANHHGRTYRRVTFRDGTNIFAELEFVTGGVHRG